MTPSRRRRAGARRRWALPAAAAGGRGRDRRDRGDDRHALRVRRSGPELPGRPGTGRARDVPGHRQQLELHRPGAPRLADDVHRSGDHRQRQRQLRAHPLRAAGVDAGGKTPFAVDQGFYNGQEAKIVLFWHNKAKNQVRVHVVGPECENVRKPALASWN
nr:hypothetical protein GCM10020093_075720 [Planobispora longispora]